MSKASPTPIEYGAGLEELSAKASPGPWLIWREPISSKDEAKRELALLVETTAEGADHLPMITDANGKCSAETGCGPTSAANAAFITAIVNTFRAGHLVPRAEVERLESENAALRKLAYDLKFAIAGGEDAPGAAEVISVEDVERWQREDVQTRNELQGRLAAAEARRAQAEAATNGMRRALGAAHFYIDAHDEELAELGITRRDALARARELRARVALSTPPVTTETVSTGEGADADESAALSTTGRDPAAPTSEWQDIASAPKDGSEVDLWANGRRYTDCHFHQGEWLHWAHGGVDDEPAWAVVIGATHYRPLPPAPSQERDEPMEDASPNATSQGGE